MGSGREAGPLRFDGLRAGVHGTPASADAKVSMHGHGADLVARATVGLAGYQARELAYALGLHDASKGGGKATVAHFTKLMSALYDLFVK